MKNKFLLIFLIFLCALFFNLNFAYSNSDFRFNILKEHLLNKDIYKKTSSVDPSITNEMFISIEDIINKSFSDQISKINIWNVGNFISEVHKLMKYYEFNLLKHIKLIDEAFLNLKIHNSDFDYKSEKNRLISYKKTSRSWEWDIPIEHNQALTQYKIHHDYAETIKLLLSATQKWKSIKPPSNATDDEIEKFEKSKKFYLASEYTILAQCYYFMKKFQFAYEHCVNAINIYENIESSYLKADKEYSARHILIRIHIMNNEFEVAETNISDLIKLTENSSWGSLTALKEKILIECKLMYCDSYRTRFSLDPENNFNYAELSEKLIQEAAARIEDYYSQAIDLKAYFFAICETNYGLLYEAANDLESSAYFFKNAYDKINFYYPEKHNFSEPADEERYKEYFGLLKTRTYGLFINKEKSSTHYAPDVVPAKIYFSFQPSSNRFVNFDHFKYYVSMFVYYVENDKPNVVYSDTGQIEIKDFQPQNEYYFEWNGRNDSNEIVSSDKDYIILILCRSENLKTGQINSFGSDIVPLNLQYVSIDKEKSDKHFAIREYPVMKCLVHFSLNIPAPDVTNLNIEIKETKTNNVILNKKIEVFNDDYKETFWWDGICNDGTYISKPIEYTVTFNYISDKKGSFSDSYSVDAYKVSFYGNENVADDKYLLLPDYKVFDEESNFLRYASRYIFGSNSPLYVKIEAENDFLDKKIVLFKTFSGSKQIDINAINELSDKSDFNYYRSMEPLYFEAFKLKLKEKDNLFEKSSLLIKDDEFEFVSLYLGDQLAERKYIDVAEFGTWHCTYKNFGAEARPQCKEEAQSISKGLKTVNNMIWTESFSISDSLVLKSHFTNCTFNSEAYKIPELDNSDLVFFSGHGNYYNSTLTPESLVRPKNVNISLEGPFSYINVERDEVKLGKKDCDWFINNNCHFLLGFEKNDIEAGETIYKIEPDNKPDYGIFETRENIIKNLEPLMENNLRILIGFKTMTYFNLESLPNEEERFFSDYLKTHFLVYLKNGDTIIDAWGKTIDKYYAKVSSKEIKVVSRILYHEDAYNDRLFNREHNNDFPIEQKKLKGKTYKLIECGTFQPYSNE